jgi:GT2 family glycosyltransferase
VRALKDVVLDASTFPVPGFRLVSSEQIRSGSDAPVRVVHPDPGLKLSFAPAAPMPPGWYQLELKFPPDGIVNVLIEFSFAGKRVLWLRLPVLARNHFLAHFRLEDALQTLTLFLSGSGRLMEPFLCRFKRIGLHGQRAAAARRGVDIFRRDGFGVVWSGLNYLWRLTRPGSIAISRGSVAVAGETTYDAWIRIFDEAPERDRARHGERLATLSERPLMSILVVLGSPDDSALKRLAQSMIGQAYPVWELLLAAPQAEHDTICEQLVTHGLDCSRLRLVNAGINEIESLNALLAVAQSDYVLPLAEGSLLRPHALLEFALTAAAWPAAELIYADEDVIDVVGDRSGWRFKPAWSPNMLEAFCYLGQPVLMRRVTVRSLGGWRAEVPDAHHDLALRFTHAVESHTIVHLAKLLVHGAAAPVSTENNLPRPVNRAPLSQPRVSLIIPTRDGAKLLRACVRSIRSLTNYENYEILIIDNGSVENATKRLFAELSTDPAIRVLPRPGPFNFSALNNFAVCEATGSIIGLVNNDIEVTQAAWLDEMVALATSPETGCVGAKLLYPDGRIQHAGVVIGLGGVAGHAHRFARASDPGYLGRLRAVHEVSAVTAACLLIRREVFDQVGGLNESLTVAFNDVDFCLRVRAAGYRNLWTPFAELIHHESVSRGRDFTPVKSKRFADEYATMQRRWGVELLNDPYYSPHLTYDREDFSLRLR